jgi:hypothetical protein
MCYLVDSSWALCKALEGSHARLVFLEVINELHRELSCLGWCLAIY